MKMATVTVYRTITESIEVEVEDTGDLDTMHLAAIEKAKTYSNSSWDSWDWEYDVEF